MCFLQAFRNVICPTSEEMGLQRCMVVIAFDKADREYADEDRVEVITKWDETDVNVELTYKLKLTELGLVEATRVYLLGDASHDCHQKESIDPVAEQREINKVLAPLLDFVFPAKKKNKNASHKRDSNVSDVVRQFPVVVEFLNGKNAAIQRKIDALETQHKKKEIEYNSNIHVSKSQKPRSQHFKVLGNINMSIFSAKEDSKKLELLK